MPHNPSLLPLYPRSLYSFYHLYFDAHNFPMSYIKASIWTAMLQSAMAAVTTWLGARRAAKNPSLQTMQVRRGGCSCLTAEQAERVGARQSKCSRFRYQDGSCRHVEASYSTHLTDLALPRLPLVRRRSWASAMPHCRVTTQLVRARVGQARTGVAWCAHVCT